MNNTTKSLKTISKDYEQLGRKGKHLGARVIVSSVFPTKGQDPIREQRILEVNYWLKGWCHKEFWIFTPCFTLPRRTSSKRWATHRKDQKECVWKTTSQAHPKGFKLGKPIFKIKSQA